MLPWSSGARLREGGKLGGGKLKVEGSPPSLPTFISFY